jgi:hypothetical protein
MKRVCNGGFPASAAAVYGQNPRSAIAGSFRIENQTDEVTGQHHLPGTRWRLSGAKLHVQVEIPLLVGLRKGLTHLWSFATVNLSF